MNFNAGILAATYSPTIIFAGPGSINCSQITNTTGAAAVNVTGGSIAFTGASSYAGGTTVSGGSLVLDAGSNNQPGPIRGMLTIQTGGTVLLQDNGNNSILGGSSTATSNINTLNINNATLTNSSNLSEVITGATVTMTGGTINGASGFTFYQFSTLGPTNLTVQSSGTTAPISAPVTLNESGGLSTITVNPEARAWTCSSAGNSIAARPASSRRATASCC